MSEGQVDMSIGQERLTGVFQGIPAIYLLLFCQAVDQLGVDPDLITEGMELSDDQLLKPGARISMRQGYIAAQRGSALAGSLGLGMVYAKTLKPTLHGPVGLLAMTSESVGAALHDFDSDRLVIYYGAADTASCVAFAHLSELIQFTKDHSTVF